MNCINCHKALTAHNTRDFDGAEGACDTCYELAKVESDHFAGDHDEHAEGPRADCPHCK